MAEPGGVPELGVGAELPLSQKDGELGESRDRPNSGGGRATEAERLGERHTVNLGGQEGESQSQQRVKVTSWGCWDRVCVCLLQPPD